MFYYQAHLCQGDIPSEYQIFLPVALKKIGFKMNRLFVESWILASGVYILAVCRNITFYIFYLARRSEMFYDPLGAFQEPNFYLTP